MVELDTIDVRRVLRTLPREVVETLEETGAILAGGYIRATVAGETPNDIDIFVDSKEVGEMVVRDLVDKRGKGRTRTIATDNATTILGYPLAVQVIDRWLFGTLEECCDSFDFTVACAAINYDLANESWASRCDPRFYVDLAARRLVYRHPIRNEDAGGSFLRLIKFYQRGYRAPLDAMAGVIARLALSVDWDHHRLDPANQMIERERFLTKVLRGKLREVDPNVTIPGLGDIADAVIAGPEVMPDEGPDPDTVST